MASKARQISRDPFGFDPRGLVWSVLGSRFAYPMGAANLVADEDLTSRALAGAGLAALVALPPLLLSSVLLAAPLAVPAAIGVCYLAVSHALASHRLRRANLIYSGILLGLVGWLLGFLLTGEGPSSDAGLIAALMAPVFAAAPAFARSLIGRSAASNEAEPDLRSAALARVARLEGLTPTERLLVLDRNAAVLAASKAARQHLGLLPDSFEHALTGLLNAKELKRVFDSIVDCRKGSAPIGIDLTFETLGGDKPLTATLSCCEDRAVAMRLCEREDIDLPTVALETQTGSRAESDASAEKPRAPESDIGKAVAFALHHSARKAEAAKVRLTSAMDPGVAAAGDRQVGRRIVHLMIDHALDACEAEGRVNITTRRLKGVVLVRTTSSPRKRAMEKPRGSEGKVDMTALKALVDGASGTVVIDERDTESIVSVRLPLAARMAPGDREAAR